MKLSYKIIKPICASLLLAWLGLGCGTTESVISPNTGATNYVWTPDPGLTNSIYTAQQIAPLLPPPIGTIAGSLATLAAVALEITRRRKNREIDSKTNLALAIIDGVERSAIPEVKEAIRKVAEHRDAQSDLKKILVERQYSAPGKL